MSYVKLEILSDSRTALFSKNITNHSSWLKGILLKKKTTNKFLQYQKSSIICADRHYSENFTQVYFITSCMAT